MGTNFKFVKNTIVPDLQPFDAVNPNSVVVMDNASIHHVELPCTFNRKEHYYTSFHLTPLTSTQLRHI